MNDTTGHVLSITALSGQNFAASGTCPSNPGDISGTIVSISEQSSVPLGHFDIHEGTWSATPEFTFQPMPDSKIGVTAKAEKIDVWSLFAHKDGDHYSLEHHGTGTPPWHED